MPRIDLLQTSFNSGEFSKRVVGRVNFERYPDAGEVVRNLIPLSQGGLTRRSGTRYVTSTKSNGIARLIPFEFSTEQAYQLELGASYVRFYRNQGQIVAADVTASITNGDFTSNITGWTDISNGTGAISHNASGGRLRLTGVGSGNEAIAEQAITITEIGTLHVVRFRAIQSTATQLIVRVGSASGGSQFANVTLADGFHTVSFTPSSSPAYLQFRTDQSGFIEVDDVSIIDNAPIEIGTNYSDTTELDALQFAQSADVLWIVHPNHEPRKVERRSNNDWSISLFSPTNNPFSGQNNFPSTVTFWEQRIWFGNTNNNPQKIWASKSANFEDFTTGTADDDAIEFTLATGQVNSIQWMTSSNALLIGTAGGELAITSDGPQITPTDIQIRRQTAHGSANLQSVQIGSATLFLQRAKRKIRRMQYIFEADGYQADDLTILADHVTRSGVSQMAWQEEPDSLLWCAREDGVLAALTFKPEERVIGWARHVLGGSFFGGDAVVESVSVIPGNAASGSEERDEVWFIVKRTINGSTVRYIEFFEKVFEGPLRDDYASDAAWVAATLEAQKDAFYLDAGATYTGAATTTVTGLGHLEGETVKVLAEGAIHPDRTVSSGQILLDFAAAKVHVGLPYKHRFKSLKIAQGNPAGTAVGKIKRIDHLVFVLMETATFQAGPSLDNLDQIEFRQVEDAMDTAVPLFDGEQDFAFDGEHDADPRYFIEGDAPLPFTLLAVAPEAAVRKA